MKVYRDLIYAAPSSEHLDGFLEQILTELPPTWKGGEPNPELTRMAEAGSRYYVFVREASGGLPPVTLVLLQSKRKAEVVNIIPQEGDGLTRDQYNTILDEFTNFADVVAAKNGVSVETNAATTDLSPWLSREAIRRLNAFSGLSNKSTGSNHPMDASRWYAFIVKCHEEHSDLAASTLARFLQEVLGWDERHADQLAGEYEFGRALLNALVASE